MNYHAFITRTPTALTFAEIKEFVANRSDLNLRINEGVAPAVLFTRSGGLQADLLWVEGQGTLVASNPETDVIATMLIIADGLGARVRDDNWQTYKSLFENYLHPDDQDDFEELQRQEKRSGFKNLAASWGRGLLIPIIIVSMILVLKSPNIWSKPNLDADIELSDEELKGAFAGQSQTPEVILVPLDNFYHKTTVELARYVQQKTKLKVKAVVPSYCLSFRPNMETKQFYADQMIHALTETTAKIRREYGQATIIYLTLYDLNLMYKDLNFVFSHHDHKNRVSIISEYRLNQGDWIAYANAKTIRERLTKLTLRTIAKQNLYLTDVNDRGSIMYSPIKSLGDLDKMGMKFEAPMNTWIEK